MEMTSPMDMMGNEPIRSLRRAEYDQLVATGCFEDERVELLFGLVVPMAPNSPPHAESTDEVRDALSRVLGQRARVLSQRPFAASDISEPEPDVFVVPTGQYRTEHPTRAYLVVEVSQSSLSRDRGLKAKLYGMSQVDEYWIVNLVQGVVEVYRDPDGGTWQTKMTYLRDAVLTLASIPGVEIAVSDLLPPLE